MIALCCPSCSQSLRVPEEYAGRKGKCPQCRGAFVVPAGCGSSQRKSSAQATPSAAIEVGQKPARREADNVGTRQDTLSKAETYWLARQMKEEKEPYLLYKFATEQAARDALLSLPCIYAACDSNELVCTGPLTFGHYRAEGGQYEAIIAGWAMTSDLFEKARSRFRQHGGTPCGVGELAPTGNRSVPATAPPSRPSVWKRLFGGCQQLPQADGIQFVKKYRKPTPLGTSCTYEVYRGAHKEAALAFLTSKPVSKAYHYLIVETPDGYWGRDKDGVYQE